MKNPDHKTRTVIFTALVILTLLTACSSAVATGTATVASSTAAAATGTPVNQGNSF